MAMVESLVSIVVHSQNQQGSGIGASKPRGSAGQQIVSIVWTRCPLTVLDEDVETLLNEQIRIEHDEAEGQRQHIVAGALAEELANRFLCDETGQQVVILAEARETRGSEGEEENGLGIEA